jgi:type II secretory pathway pseudopilin PulG
MRLPRQRSLWAAFTMLEMLFSLTILAAVSAGVFTLFYSNSFGASLSPDLSNAMADAQTALREMGNDFRAASAFATPTNTGGVRVTFASGPAVEYYQSGTTLKRLVDSTGSSPTTVVSGLVSGSGLSLTYYTSSMSAIAGPMDSTKYGQAAVVDVGVTVNLEHSVFGNVVRTSRILLRNKVS